jgi:uncharacterized protein YbcC (UPF0753/DUF2309 family)
MVATSVTMPFTTTSQGSAAETAEFDSSGFSSLEAVLAGVAETVAPLWPLKDFVAVNPYLGLSKKRFLDAGKLLQHVYGGETLPTSEHFRESLDGGAINRQDVELALTRCRFEYPSFYADLTVDEILDFLDDNRLDKTNASEPQRILTVAEQVDRLYGTSWATPFIREISRLCAAHFDEGQAIWPSPWKNLSLYDAWRESSRYCCRLEKLGLRGFGRYVAALPSTPQQAIAAALSRLRVPKHAWGEFLLCQLFSIPGWSSYVKCQSQTKGQAGKSHDDLIGLLAIRLTYDCSLTALTSKHDVSLPGHYDQRHLSWTFSETNTPTKYWRARYALLTAAEIAHERQLCSTLQERKPSSQNAAANIKAQMVFCIDVRSERIRRSLEKASDCIETFGFAGFFGIAMEYVPLGADSGSAQCPVLLNPNIKVHETIRGSDSTTLQRTTEQRRTIRLNRRLWKSFQSSAASCFSFVESLGLLYLKKLVGCTFAHRPPVETAKFDGVSAGAWDRLGPNANESIDHANDSMRQIDLAHSLLRNLGLTTDFARLVVFCGHGSETSNNPYQASLDCGACGGHSGEPNARFAAALLNNQSVRRGLLERGISIPGETWFLAAVHNTTIDEICFFDADAVPPSHASDLADLRRWALDAAIQTRKERTHLLGASSPDDLVIRSTDWSEVRPEWGLAGNAAFIVAPRSRTLGRNLEGRTFLHSYDYLKDPEFETLELIMTAPMVVTNWINLQYYASTVDNHAFGAGNKVIHNVVGRLGIVEGNEGDLKTGLPWQSIHDGTKFQHEPLRLLVIIEAPCRAIDKILTRHPGIQDLAANGWLRLMAIDGNIWRRYGSDGQWEDSPAFATRA